MNDNRLIDVDGVRFAYENTPVLENVCLTLDRGEFACVVGPNGGGKTTLLKLILGLLTPDAGSIRLFSASPRSGRVNVGYVPQSTHLDRFFPIRVSDVVGMGTLTRWRGFRGSQPGKRQRILEALERVQLDDVASRWFGELSGGQRQRVLIARALATGAELLVLDEPTANVDPAAEAVILDLLESLRATHSALVVTHETSVVSRFLAKIVCVNRHVHLHPATDRVDDELLRHICGYRPHAAEASH